MSQPRTNLTVEHSFVLFGHGGVQLPRQAIRAEVDQLSSPISRMFTKRTNQVYPLVFIKFFLAKGDRRFTTVTQFHQNDRFESDSDFFVNDINLLSNSFSEVMQRTAISLGDRATDCK